LRDGAAVAAVADGGRTRAGNCFDEAGAAYGIA
jgi:hypothetical protein